MKRVAGCIRFLIWVSVLSSVLPAARPAGASALSSGSNAALEATLRDRLAVRSMTMVELDLPDQAGDGFTATVTLEGVKRRLVLRPYSLRSANFQLMQRDADGQLSAAGPIPPPCTVRGTVEGLPGSEVAGSLFDGQLEALIRLDADSDVLIGIQPAKGLAPDAPVSTHIVYESSAAMPSGGRCGAGPLELDATAPVPRDFGPQLSLPPGGSAQGATRVAEIAIEGDHPFWQLNGSSWPAYVRDVELVMNAVDFIYHRDVDIYYYISTITAWMNPDSYMGNNANLLLAQLRDNHTYPGTPWWDAWHMMSGRILDDGAVGIAYQPGFCTTGNPYFAFGISAAKHIENLIQRTAVTAHELGHNWSAGHCDGNPGCDLMCSAIGGCEGNMTSFTFSAPIISFYRDSPPCAGVLDLPMTTVWVDWRNSGQQNGTPSEPFTSTRAAYWRVEPGGTISIASGVYADSHLMQKAATLVATGGLVEITGFSPRPPASGGLVGPSTSNAQLFGR